MIFTVLKKVRVELIILDFLSLRIKVRSEVQ